MKTILAILIICFVGTETILAQETHVAAGPVREEANLEFINRYKENRDLSYTAPFGEIGAPQKFIIAGRLTTTYLVLATKRLPFAVAIIPDFTVKVLNERSAGVRTPSFRLGAAAYMRLNSDPEHYKYGELSFTHHSNGQDGDALNPDGSINTYNGNFNTNYLSFIYRFGSFSLREAGKGVYFSYNHRVGAEIHKGFNYEPALQADYGFTRILYGFSFRRYTDQQKEEKEMFRINADLSYAINQMPAYPITSVKKRLNAELSAHYSLPFMQNVFLMACAGYYGEDPYNIYYRNHYGYMRFGLSSGFIRNRSR